MIRCVEKFTNWGQIRVGYDSDVDSRGRGGSEADEFEGESGKTADTSICRLKLSNLNIHLIFVLHRKKISRHGGLQLGSCP